jgi:TP901-1 family phage major tail protein
MAGQRGRDVLIKVGSGGSPEAFATVAGIRAKTITLQTGLADATSADSAERWRELLAGAGAKRADVAGSGVFKDAASDARLRGLFFAGEAARFELVIAGMGFIRGPFLVSELAYGGAHDGEATFSVRLSSAGVLAFEAAGEGG